MPPCRAPLHRCPRAGRRAPASPPSPSTAETSFSFPTPASLSLLGPLAFLAPLLGLTLPAVLLLALAIVRPAHLRPVTSSQLHSPLVTGPSSTSPFRRGDRSSLIRPAGDKPRPTG